MSPTFIGEAVIQVNVRLLELPTINALVEVKDKVCSVTAVTVHIDWSTKKPADVWVVIVTAFDIEVVGGVFILLAENTTTVFAFTVVENIELASIFEIKLSQVKTDLRGEAEIAAQVIVELVVVKGV